MPCRYTINQTVTLRRNKTYGAKIIPSGTNGVIITTQQSLSNYYIKFQALNGPVLVYDHDLV
ncbi:MAG: hypothetical protein JNJ40_18170 [Bacteroidia bacterium]|nr:hypothetical protein [Bacteroidia bacterium]